MHIDISTIAVLVVITHLIQVVVFVHQYKTVKVYDGIGWWLLWSCFLSVGMTIFSIRTGRFDHPALIAVQNLLIISGTIFIYVGIMKFLEQKVNVKWAVGIFISFLLPFLYFLIIEDNIKARSFMISVSISFIAFFTAFNFIKYRIKSISSSIIFLAVSIIFHGLIFAYIALSTLNVNPDFVLILPNHLGALQLLDGLIIGLLWTFGFVMMVNQRLNSEMKESKEHFEQIFNTSPDAAIITNLNDGTIIDLNDAYTRITGFNKSDCIGKSTFDINIWKDIKDRNEVVKSLKEKGYCENYEAQFIRKDGTEITGLMSAKIIDLQMTPHIISISRDITERKKADRKISEQNEMLKRINSEKDKFFSIIAHDLRSPFSLFLGLTEIMSKDIKNMKIEDIQEYVNHLNKSANNLYRLLTNLLEWSKMQRGLTAFNPEILNVTKIMRETLDVYLDIVDQKGIKINSSIPNNLIAFCDKQMLETILRNLMSNAIKFTSKGGSIEVTGRNIKTKLEITIRDTGIGMSEDILKNIFRIDNLKSRKGTENEPSTGLGLLLCKEFVKKNNGEIFAQSEEGKGSMFKVILEIKG